MPQVLEDKVAFEKVAQNWYESSLTMSQILAERNILYFTLFSQINIIRQKEYLA
ncbi:MAG: hypothetical protein SWX82_15500 [Cyanobacteriota bacterium]|nr:hypothetical protein [Cyanobacteriota bacterium]